MVLAYNDHFFLEISGNEQTNSDIGYKRISALEFSQKEQSNTEIN